MKESQANAVADDLDLAVHRAEEIHLAPNAITTFRIFKGHVHRLALLGIVEACVVLLAVYAAFFFRYPAESFTSIESATGPIWTQAVLAAGVMLAALIAMGLYQLRQRAEFSGVLARLVFAIFIAEAGLTLLSYLAPSVSMGRGVLDRKSVV